MNLTKIKKEKVLIFKLILFKNVEIIHEKVIFLRLNASICIVPIETANMRNILPSLVIFNGLIDVTLKRDLIYRDHVYFEPFCLYVIHQVLAYLKSTNKLYEEIFIAKNPSKGEIFRFSDIV